jgi:MFS family permease
MTAAPVVSHSDLRAIIFGAMLAMFLAALDQTIVAPALPAIARDLGDFTLISWIVTAYLLTGTCVTPIVGKLSDLYGRRRILAACLLAFMAGSALCGLASDMVLLIVARGLQGLLVADRALRRLPVESRRASIDFASSGLLSGATVALLLVLSLGGKRLPWSAPETLVLAVAALGLGGLFALRQANAREPILPPRFLTDRVIGPVLAASFLLYGSYLAIVVLTPIYLQVALGRAADETGLLMIPLILTSTLTANYAGRYSQRTGRYKRTFLVGVPIAVVGMALLAALAAHLSALGASAILFAVGAGLGPTFPSSTLAVQNAVGRSDLGSVNGALAFTRALGAAILIAAVSALVLGLAADALPATGPASSLEDLTRQALPAAARAAVTWAFAVAFGALAAALLVALAILTRVEERPLGDQPGIRRAPARDRAP